MCNTIMLVGKLVEMPIESTDDKRFTTLTLAVNRSFKNADGLYETDLFDCEIWEGLSKQIINQLNKGDVVGVRGRLQTQINDDGKKELRIIAEKLTFLSQTPQKN